MTDATPQVTAVPAVQFEVSAIEPMGTPVTVRVESRNGYLCVVQIRDWETIGSVRMRNDDALVLAGCIQTVLESGVDTTDRSKARWISVEDRLPTASGDVLVYVEGRFGIAYYSHKLVYFSNCSTPGRINSDTYWMPLPDPPEDVT